MPESPLCAPARARGTACVEVGGWMVPESFGDSAAEYQALHARAAIVDLAFRGRLRVTGADRSEFLQGMLSNDVKRLTVGTGCPALLLSDQGKIVADLVVLARADAIALDGMRAAVEAAAVALERYVVADDVELEIVGAEHQLGILGPGAAAALAALGVGTLPTEPYAHVVCEHDGVPLHVVRLPGPAAGGFHCHLPARAAVAWWETAVAAGIAPVGQRALDVWRIEGGEPWHGRDIGAETLALEAPLAAAISFGKGCYLGQEVVERVTARGHVNRKLVGLALEGDTAPAAGDKVWAGEREVGWVTSAAWSWRLECPIALAYVRREHLTPGTVVTVRTGGAERAATVRELPFV